MADSHKNAAYSLVATAPSPATSGTSLVVTAGEGGRFPAVPFNATIWASGAQPTFAAGGTTGGNFEIVRVTAISTDTLTITRAQESTSARTVVVGDQFSATVTAKTLTDMEGMTVGGDLTGTLPNPTLVGSHLAGLAIYGDGSDGTVTFDGSTTILGMAPSSSVYTLSRDFFFAAATINSGVTIKTNGYRIYCAGTLTGAASSSLIHANGPAAAGFNSGTAGGGVINTSSTINAQGGTTNGLSSAGGNGGTAGAGSAGGTPANPFSWGVAGGAGGAGSAGAGAAAGSLHSAGATQASFRSPYTILVGGVYNATGSWAYPSGGTGGGGGGGDGTNIGGAGGGGGGIVLVFAKVFAGTGAIQARGAAGGSPTVGNTGGGGGGGGGYVAVVSSSVSGGAVSGWTIDANGGAAGAKNGTGVNGSGGGTGNVILLPN